MAKTKQTRRMMAMALAAAVTMSSVPVVAFADVVDNGDGTSTSTTTTTTTTGPTTTGPDSNGGEGTSASPEIKVTVEAHERKDTTTSVTTDNETGATVSTTETTTDTDTTKTTTETNWKDVSEDKTVAFDGEKVNTTVTETTTTDGVTGEPETVRTHETTDNTTTTTETTADGTVETVVNQKTEDGTREDGTIVDSQVTSTTTTKTDAEGNVIEETYVEDGSEETTTEEDVAVGDEGQPEVKVELTPGETVESEPVKGEVVKVESSYIKDGDNWESKEIISEIERVVKAELSKETEETVVVDKNELDIESLAPVDYEGKFFDNKEGLMTGLSDTQWTYDYENLSPEEWKEEYGFEKPERPKEDGYDYQWTGYGDATNAVRAVAMEVTYKKDPATGKAMVDPKTGEFIVEKVEYRGKYGDGMDSTPTIFTLTKYDENGEPAGYYYGYCIDTDTEAMPGSWYEVANLEDSDYYPDEASADKLRAVVNNGYWSQEEGKGSLAQMQANMEAYYAKNSDATVTIDDKDGNPITYKVSELLAREDGKGKMNDADALAVTQAVIWSHANGTLAVEDGQDGAVIDGIYSVVKPKSNLANTDRDYDYARDALLKAAYNWLMSVEPEDAKDVVINEQNNVEDVTLVVGDKAKGFVENTDDNTDNDVYNTSLDFTLAFVPDKDKDSMLVYVMDKEGNAMKDAGGNAIVRRLAGTNAEGETYETITPDANGVYTLGGLVFQEKTEIEFDLRLEGIQYLDEGVYIYRAQDNASQTMVGIASGEQEVDVSKSMTLTFEVDEHKTVTATRTWHKERSSNKTPEDPTTPPGGDNPPSGGGSNPPGGDTDIPDPDVPLSDIPDEDVPLADIGEEEVPLVAGAEDVEEPMVLGAEEEAPLIAATGDSNHMAAGFGGMFAALAGMFMLRRKKEQ